MKVPPYRDYYALILVVVGGPLAFLAGWLLAYLKGGNP